MNFNTNEQRNVEITEFYNPIILKHGDTEITAVCRDNGIEYIVKIGDRIQQVQKVSDVKTFQVLKTILDEIAYSPSKSHVKEEFPLGSTLSAIQKLLNDATSYWYSSSDPNYGFAMKKLRGIAALCVSAGVKYSMPKRQRTSASVSSGTDTIPSIDTKPYYSTNEA